MWKKIRQYWIIWEKPYQRYQHQRLIHTLRLATSVVLATAIGHWFRLPHGEWIPITVFVVLGTMPYQGSVSAKAWERMVGTVIGLGIGITLLSINQKFLNYNSLFFVLLWTLSAGCAWQSLGKKGYMAMLAGLTMCMLLGRASDDWLNETMMRGLNVIIGAVIALNASQLVPIKSILVWRFTTADNMTDCSRLIAQMTAPKAVQNDVWLSLLNEQKKINARVVKARSIMASAAVESHIPLDMMENMQLAQRAIVSSVNMMLVNIPKLPKAKMNSADEKLLTRHFNSLQYDLRLTAKFLKGDWRQNIVPSFDEEDEIRALAARLPFEWQGLIWTSMTIRAELFTLLTLLRYNRDHWLLKSEQERLDESI